MTTTVQKLIANLKHYPDQTVVAIKDVDDMEFTFVDFKHENNTLNIVIGSTEDEE
ncbi:MAG: hypothetical protein KME52_04870 [Desmonostoc geniculatum HA4340-LM1]|jgi:hypothetical protein|nr:hypothetical protein [Desmonostoc geniculatum HA4340-LM1]